MLQMRLWRHWRHAFRLVVANSYAVRQHLEAEGFQGVKVVWNGVPDQGPRPPLTGPPTVAFAGRLLHNKGVDVLLRAFAQVIRQFPTARLLLAGDGPEGPALRRRSLELGLSTAVTWLGHLPSAEVAGRLASAWVQVVPSLWAEPFGLVAVEAMMRGTAVIASVAGGLSEIVQDRRNGLLVPPGDVPALTDALASLLGDRDHAESMGRAARERALAEFSLAAHADKLIQLYQALQHGRESHATDYFGTKRSLT